MVTSFTFGHGRILLPLALAAGVAVALAFLLLGSAEAGAAAKQRKVIGTAVSNGIRIQVTAIRTTRDTATVKVAAFERSGGAWDRLGRALRVGQRSGWFWKVVTRPYGVRTLTLSQPGGRFSPRIALRLLISPSIGPSATFRFVVEGDRLMYVDV
jgi:hypothetical protein